MCFTGASAGGPLACIGAGPLGPEWPFAAKGPTSGPTSRAMRFGLLGADTDGTARSNDEYCEQALFGREFNAFMGMMPTVHAEMRRPIREPIREPVMVRRMVDQRAVSKIDLQTLPR